MSVRREARARDLKGLVTGAGGIPSPLLIGRCIEVWAAHDAQIWDSGAPGIQIPWASSASRRFGSVRRWWLGSAGVRERESWRVIPSGAPWSVEYLSNQAERSGQSVDARVAERFARVGLHVSELDDLRDEANQLLAVATGEKAHKQIRSRT